MKSGISTDSYADTATFAVVTGTADADYPVSNLGDLAEPGVVARITPDTGAIAVTATLPAARSIQFAALVEHTIPADATVRVRFYSDVLTTVVSDTGVDTIPDPTDDPQTYPVLLPAALSVRSVRIDIAGLTDDLDIGGLEIAAFWEWPWLTGSLDAGFRLSGDEIDLVGGASAGGEGDAPRTRSGEVKYLDLGVSVTTRIDAQKLHGLTRPFVYLEDYDTPSSWPRDCFLATNTALPPGVAEMFDRDTFQFRIEEHRR